MSEHSKTPWELRGLATLRGADGDYVATIENNSRRSANAAFIVKACNNFDELVEALEKISRQRNRNLTAANKLAAIFDVVDAVLAKAID